LLLLCPVFFPLDFFAEGSCRTAIIFFVLYLFQVKHEIQSFYMMPDSFTQNLLLLIISSIDYFAQAIYINPDCSVECLD
jgi:hypothetical protein